MQQHQEVFPERVVAAMGCRHAHVHGAHGVVLAHPLSMREAPRSIRGVSHLTGVCFLIGALVNQFTSRPRGVTVSTLDSESSDRGSNPREAFLFVPTVVASRACASQARIQCPKPIHLG